MLKDKVYISIKIKSILDTRFNDLSALFAELNSFLCFKRLQKAIVSRVFFVIYNLPPNYSSEYLQLR